MTSRRGQKPVRIRDLVGLRGSAVPVVLARGVNNLGSMARGTLADLHWHDDQQSVEPRSTYVYILCCLNSVNSVDSIDGDSLTIVVSG